MQMPLWVATPALVSVLVSPVQAGPKVLRTIARSIYATRATTTLAPSACDCVSAFCNGRDPIWICGAAGKTDDGRIARGVRFGLIEPVESDGVQGCAACACNEDQAATVTLEPEGGCLALSGRRPGARGSARAAAASHPGPAY